MSDEIEALIQAALYGQEDTTPISAAQREVYSFIKGNGIVAGENPIAFTLIWELFQHQNPKSHTGRINFKRSFDKYFTGYRNAAGHYYRLDPVPLGLEPTYSHYTDKRFFKNAKGSSRRYGKKKK
jgi:hypothetical protein